MKVIGQDDKGNDPISFLIHNSEPLIYFIIAVGDFKQLDPISTREGTEVQLVTM